MFLRPHQWQCSSLVAYFFVLKQDMWLLTKKQEALTSPHLLLYIQCCVCFCVGSSSSVRSQPDEFTLQLTVPTDLFRPISPHSHSDSESIPRLPPPRRAHALSRTLRRQVTNLHCFRFFTSVVYCPPCCLRWKLRVMSAKLGHVPFRPHWSGGFFFNSIKKLQRLVSLFKTLCSLDKKLFFDTAVGEFGKIKPCRALGYNYNRALL